MGGDLIPAVDNVNTFEVALNTITDNRIFNDTAKVLSNDYVVAGDLNDPEFGQTHANFHFNVLPSALGVYPFVGIDSPKIIDSIVLSLDYVGGYGDVATGTQTLRVFEIDPNAGFSKDSLYRYADPATDFATTGSELGSKTFAISSLKDSVEVRTDTTTAKEVNVVRIKLNNAFANRFLDADTSSTGAYHLDSSRGDNFRRLFAGFAVKADNNGNVLSYFDLTNTTKTRLTFYFRVLHANNGKIDTLHADFVHSTNGQANYVKQTAGGNWATYLNNGSEADDKIYLQSAPAGAYASILIPDLRSLGNKVVHRAEIIATQVPSASDNIFTPQPRLFLDRKSSGSPDTTIMLYRDLTQAADGTLNFNSFGVNFKSGKYIFNITRFVQGILTRNEPLDTLRLFSPLRIQEHAPMFVTTVNTKGLATIPVADRIAEGRVVLGGGSYANPDQRLRLRIIYSNL